MKKILVIDESPLFRDYLAKKLVEKKFEVVEATNGLDGAIKMRREVPDLIIMDYYLTRKNSLEVLKEKRENPNVASAPVIMVSSKIDKGKLVELKPYNVRKFFTKPLKIDVLLKSVAELSGETIEMDDTPCMIEAHFNDEILFIEIALGLNVEKIELLQYKITELLDLYQVRIPKVLLMLSGLPLKPGDTGKLQALLRAVFQYGGANPRNVKILTSGDFVKGYIASKPELAGIEVVDSLEKAMDALLVAKPEGSSRDPIARERLLASLLPKGGKEETVEMRFSTESVSSAMSFEQLGDDIAIGVVDDDEIIRELIKTVFGDTGWTIRTFVNGREFIESADRTSLDLIFLDIMMPEMDGFQVLAQLRQESLHLPIIVLSALSQKETVVRAVGFGVSSYLIKPLRPELIRMKALEILKTNF